MMKDLSTRRARLICLVLFPVADRQRQLMLWHECVPKIIFLEVLAPHRNIAVVAADLDLRALRDSIAVRVESNHHRGFGATVADRLDENGNAITSGSQVEIGGNERYVSMCRKHLRKSYSMILG